MKIKEKIYLIASYLLVLFLIGLSFFLALKYPIISQIIIAINFLAGLFITVVIIKKIMTIIKMKNM